MSIHHVQHPWLALVGPHLAWLGPPVLPKRIRPGWVMFSQETAVKFFCDESIIRELESNFVVELPFVPSLRMESQRNAAVRDFSFRRAALDL